MKALRIVGISTLVVGAVLVTAAFATQDKGKDAKGKATSASMDPEMMAKWTAFMTPGPEHKLLDARVGKWSAHMKMWMDPSAPAMESDGTSEIKWVMGNRFLDEEFKGTAMGQPFEGMGLVGYDNLKKKYIGTWADNMGTGIMTTEGTYDAGKKTMTCTSECLDATMTKYVPARMVETTVDANTFKLEMFGPDKSGKEFRSMEITYTRAK